MTKSELKVKRIKNGTVIDHITANRSLNILNMLKLPDDETAIMVAINVESSDMGRKDIIKIDNEIEIDTDILGYIDPDVTVNVIKDGKVSKKLKIDLPEVLTDVIVCKNPRCITSTEHSLKHRFRLTDRKNRIYRCVYCETRAE